MGELEETFPSLQVFRPNNTSFCKKYLCSVLHNVTGMVIMQGNLHRHARSQLSARVEHLRPLNVNGIGITGSHEIVLYARN